MTSAYNWGNEPPDPRTEPVELNPPPQADQIRDQPGGIPKPKPTPPAGGTTDATQIRYPSSTPAPVPAIGELPPKPKVPARFSPRIDSKVEPIRPVAPPPAPKTTPQEDLANVLLYLQSKALGAHVFCQTLTFLGSSQPHLSPWAEELSRFMLASYNDLMAWGGQVSARPTCHVDDGFSDEGLYGEWAQVLGNQIQEFIHCLAWISACTVASTGLKHWASNTAMLLELHLQRM